MEVCRQPGGKICWHDIVSTLAGSSEERAILASPAPEGWGMPVAVCTDPLSKDAPRVFGRTRSRRHTMPYDIP